MNISVKNNPVLARSFTGNQMKSTQEKMQRRQTMENRVAALEQQKENLKNKQCDTLEEIAEKLEMFHSYEDEIAAVKKSFNNAEMFHTMDEARERGEKIAEAAEKSKPKTKEERKKEAIEEATGTEENSGVLSELLEEMDESMEEMTEEMAEDVTESLTKDLTEGLMEEAAKDMTEDMMELLSKEQLLEEDALQKRTAHIPIDFRV